MTNHEEILKKLKTVNPEIIKELISIRNHKFIVVKNQRYAEAAELRDKERAILRKYDVLDEYSSYIYSNKEWILRDLKLNELLD
jgi:hypothetical protein